jgi:Protein of unknown function (DUF3037)
MEHIFKYAVITAIPDPRRGERVNIGIVIFLTNQLDIRFSDLPKVTAIAGGGNWAEYADQVADRLRKQFSVGHDPEKLISRTPESIIRFSEIAWFSISDETLYEPRISHILETLVNKPRPAIRPKSSRINTEMAGEFRRANVLAGPREGLEDHKVVRDYYISKEEELRADFVVKNGAIHATATLDLRKAAVHISHATLPALILDKAVKTFGRETKRFGVYAAQQSTLSQFKAHLTILADYADNIYNWLDPADRRAYTRTIFSAINGPDSYKLS